MTILTGMIFVEHLTVTGHSMVQQQHNNSSQIVQVRLCISI